MLADAPCVRDAVAVCDWRERDTVKAVGVTDADGDVDGLREVVTVKGESVADGEADELELGDALLDAV